MAAFDFPSSPSINQTYTANGVTWKWNGTMWMRVSGAGYLEKIEEGNSKIEVDDSGSGNVTVTTDGTEKLRITSAGQMLLGTTTPGNGNADNLTLADSGNCGITIRSGTSNFGEIYFSDATSGAAEYDGYIAYSHSSRYMVLATAQTERLRITSAGNVGINEANPQSSLHISGPAPTIRFEDTGANGSAFSIIEDNNGLLKLRNDAGNAGTGSGIVFEVDAAERLRITPAGDVGIGTAVPITGSGYASLSLADTSGGQIEFKKFGAQTHYIWSDNNLNIGADYFGTGQNLVFKVNGNNERLRITSTGRMGLGTNDPAALLEVRDSENTTQGNAQIRISKGVGSGAAPSSTSRANTYLHLGGTEWGSGANGQYLIGFGYTNDEVGTGIPAYVGFKETTTSGYTQGDLIFGTRDSNTGTNNATERMRIDKDGHTRFGSSGTGYDSAWSHSNYGNTEVAIDGGGGYGALHFRGDGAGSVNTRFSMGVGDEIFYMCYDDVNARHNIMVNSSGHVRMPAQPAFHSRGGTTLSANTNNVIIGGATEFNTGGHYSTSNGRFTAPVDGVYQFSFWGLLYVHSSGVVNIFYSKNGTQYAHIVQGGADSTNHTSRSGIIHMGMSAGDYAELRINPGSTGANAYNSQWNMCGHLIG